MIRLNAWAHKGSVARAVADAVIGQGQQPFPASPNLVPRAVALVPNPSYATVWPCLAEEE